VFTDTEYQDQRGDRRNPPYPRLVLQKKPMPTPSRIPAGLDPLRRVHIPRGVEPPITIGAEVDPTSVGMTRAGVEDVWHAALRLYRHRMYPALTVTVMRHGEIVLERSIGWASGVGPGSVFGRGQDEVIVATPQTPFCVYSASKAVTATLMHTLHDRGVLDLGDPIAEYVPAFARRAPKITIEHVMSHRAGIPFLPGHLMDPANLHDREVMLAGLSELEIVSRPGSRLSYHAVSGGFILAEVVLAATGKDIRTLLAETILDPLGFRWTNYGVAPEDVAQVGRAYVTGALPLPPLSTKLTRVLGLHPDQITRITNDPRVLTGVIPSGNVVSTATELARFMDVLRKGGSSDGVTIMSPRTLRRALVERSYHEFDRSLGLPIRFSNGYMLGAKALSLYGPDTELAFGHLGFSNVMTWADPAREISVGLITSGKPIVGPHLAAFWDFGRRLGRAAPQVKNPVLFTL
jgi:CubicO group peptidase (beta-lactamase class C family)